MKLLATEEEKITTMKVILPKELYLGKIGAKNIIENCCTGDMNDGCQGDGCNDDTGGCPSDASCGQDC